MSLLITSDNGEIPYKEVIHDGFTDKQGVKSEMVTNYELYLNLTTFFTVKSRRPKHLTGQFSFEFSVPGFFPTSGKSILNEVVKRI